jgi:iron-sulfur cluster repair protein YtfE (RIC family)
LFRQQLNIHFVEEESIIFPLYKRNSPLPNFEIDRCLEVYAAEHKKLTLIAEEAEGQVREIISSKSTDVSKNPPVELTL